MDIAIHDMAICTLDSSLQAVTLKPTRKKLQQCD